MSRSSQSILPTTVRDGTKTKEPKSSWWQFSLPTLNLKKSSTNGSQHHITDNKHHLNSTTLSSPSSTTVHEEDSIMASILGDGGSLSSKNQTSLDEICGCNSMSRTNRIIAFFACFLLSAICFTLV